jgi:hypothetical protein
MNYIRYVVADTSAPNYMFIATKRAPSRTFLRYLNQNTSSCGNFADWVIVDFPAFLPHLAPTREEKA